MRSVVISAVLHVALVSLALLGTPRLFDTPTQAIEVDIVREQDVEQAAEKPKPEEPKPEKKPEKPNAWEIPPEKPLIQLPDFSRQSEVQTSSPAPKPPQSSASPPPANSQQAALTPQAQSPASPQPQPQAGRPPPGAGNTPPATAPTTPSVFDPSNIPMLMDLPNAGGQEKGFDFEATVTANISADDRAAFKAHLRQCWKQPDGLTSPTTRVVLRVYLKRDGGLASEPVLIEASASRDGPAVLQAAKNALKGCQPYAFLPADKYREWRVLDLSFTPRDMGG
jgi:hypothetical protein